RPPEPEKGRQVAGLVDHGPHIPGAPKPAEPRGEARVDRHEQDVVAVTPQPVHERPRLNGLPTQDLQGRRDDRDPHGRPPPPPSPRPGAPWRPRQRVVKMPRT